MLGLPDEVTVCLFDMDGVLTRTAVVHAAAWKETFDAYLQVRSSRTGETGPAFAPMSPSDYDRYVDGKPRLDGTRAFLESRGLELPVGTPEDPPTAETLHGLSNAKNGHVLAKLAEGKVEAYEGSIRYVEAARRAGLKTAVVSSSANTQAVLESAGIADLFDARIDGIVAVERKLPGKPAPDTYLAGAAEFGMGPESAAVFEDALAGVAAGRAGGFRLVVGVDRVGQAAALREHGADVVVKDLDELMEDT
jgi:HAD superfamily hydrolase (TIGR01509 family)